MDADGTLEKEGRQAKIFIVDDDARLRDLLLRYLTVTDYAVTTAVNALFMNRS